MFEGEWYVLLPCSIDLDISSMSFSINKSW